MKRLLLLALLLMFVVLPQAEAKGFRRPRLPGPDGDVLEIWARSSSEGYLNAKRFCRSVKDEPVDGPPFSWGYTCGSEDAEGYLDFRKGQWIVEAPVAKEGPSLCERTGYCPTDQHGWPVGTAKTVACDLHGHGYPILDWVYCGD